MANAILVQLMLNTFVSFEMGIWFITLLIQTLDDIIDIHLDLILLQKEIGRVLMKMKFFAAFEMTTSYTCHLQKTRLILTFNIWAIIHYVLKLQYIQRSYSWSIYVGTHCRNALVQLMCVMSSSWKEYLEFVF